MMINSSKSIKIMGELRIGTRLNGRIRGKLSFAKVEFNSNRALCCK